MFGQLRANNPLYILNRQGTPSLEIGTVVNVTAPMPQIGTIGQPTMYTVDVTARIGDQNVTYQKLPANLDIADFAGNGNVVIASQRSAMNAELQSMRQRSFDIVNSVDYHNGIIQTIDKIVQELNPEEAQKAQQQEEINSLKIQMAQMSQGMSELMRMNKELMEQLKTDQTAKKPNKE